MEHIITLWQKAEKYRAVQKNLYLTFVDIDKAYDYSPRPRLCKAMHNHQVKAGYIRITQDMFHMVQTRVKTAWAHTSSFPVTVGVHQGSALSPYIFLLLMNDLMQGVEAQASQCMTFDDDVAQKGETWEELQHNLGQHQQALKPNGHRISREKTENMACQWEEGQPWGEIRLSG